MYAELRQLHRRGRLVNGCIALLTLCSMMIGVTIILLFLGETAELPARPAQSSSKALRIAYR